MPTHLGAQRLPTCLDSLAAQDLDPDRFEIVVVLNGPEDGSRVVLETFRTTHPRHRLRVVELSEPGLANARNVGLQAARGEYVTYLDDDDQVTRTYLAAMLAEADPELVVAAMVGDLDEAAGEDRRPDLETYVGRGLAPLQGRTVPGEQAVTTFSYNNAKLLATDLARAVQYRTDLASGEDHVYWLTLFARAHFRVHVLRRPDALYLRTVRAGSLGRQQPGYDFSVVQRLKCLRAFEDVARRDAPTALVARGLSRGQAGFIRDYLAQRPHEHGRLAEDVLRLGLREFPWSLVNEGLARDLAICYCFPPDLDTSGTVAAKRLRERGLVTDVISHDLSRLRTRDPRVGDVAAEVVGRTHVVTGTPSFSSWASAPPFAEEAWATVLRWEEEQGPYRSVYSRAMAVNAHFAAALVKVRRPGIEWVAEFSDPLDVNTVGEHRVGDVGEDWLSEELATAMSVAGYTVGEDLRLFEWVERLTYALADRVVFTNPLQMEMMLGYCRDARLVERVRSIAEVSAHPVLPRRFYELAEPADPWADDDAVHLAYFGVFYSTRDLGDVVRALDLLRYEQRSRIRLHVYTAGPDPLTLQMVRAGLAGVVTVHPYVPFLEFLNLSTRFDVLVVTDAATAEHHAANPYLPSKLADYAGSGTPVWAVYEKGSMMSAMQLEHMTELGDVEAAADVLRGLVSARAGR